MEKTTSTKKGKICAIIANFKNLIALNKNKVESYYLKDFFVTIEKILLGNEK